MKSNIGLGEYRRRDYKEILSLSEDKENMEDTWEEWKANKNRVIKEFEKMGLRTIDIIVIPQELVKYCRENGLKVNGESRAQFIQHKLMKLHGR